MPGSVAMRAVARARRADAAPGESAGLATSSLPRRATASVGGARRPRAPAAAPGRVCALRTGVRTMARHRTGGREMAEIDGATLIARSLKQHGVQYMFGIVGVPVVPVAFAAQREGITYIGMRHEQSASYAAQAVGYLTGRPGACLVVSGPGMTNAISGLANAWSNRWPMILLGGASDIAQHGMGAFQEAPQ